MTATLRVRCGIRRRLLRDVLLRGMLLRDVLLRGRLLRDVLVPGKLLPEIQTFLETFRLTQVIIDDRAYQNATSTDEWVMWFTFRIKMDYLG